MGKNPAKRRNNAGGNVGPGDSRRGPVFSYTCNLFMREVYVTAPGRRAVGIYLTSDGDARKGNPVRALPI